MKNWLKEGKWQATDEYSGRIGVALVWIKRALGKFRSQEVKAPEPEQADVDWPNAEGVGRRNCSPATSCRRPRPDTSHKAPGDARHNPRALRRRLRPGNPRRRNWSGRSRWSSPQIS